ncbi:energy transducer TonB [Hymenobacter glacieicola]|uniref:TonB C-terminal domain-containing protein n=1 Tax=Hymenobacter glacieicola TaxID=1562124 RepID=A0ABQ1X645_9BACT|nr:energy transducer TonB [Hymenobacter glacieicola]GGG61717.1 hypothetical protein GCM10011378_42210 [Hymenobacter glacieicola]
MLRISTLLLLFVLPASAALGQTLTDNTAFSGTGSASGEPPVYHVVDEMPTFRGGAPAFFAFLQKELRYPQEAELRNVSGKVYVSFVVDEQGRIRDAQVLRGLGAGLDQEALRLVRLMPWWVPGRLKGQAVRVAYTLPIAFKLL